MIKRLYLSYVRLNRPELSVAAKDVDRGILRAALLSATTKALLLCYVLFMFKPCIPYVSDAVAHVFWKHTHIATVHNGAKSSQHVKAEVAKSVDESQKDKSTNKHKYETQGAEYLVPQNTYFPLPCRYTAVVYCSFTQSVPGLFLPPDDIPPKA